MRQNKDFRKYSDFHEGAAKILEALTLYRSTEEVGSHSNTNVPFSAWLACFVTTWMTHIFRGSPAFRMASTIWRWPMQVTSLSFICQNRSERLRRPEYTKLWNKLRNSNWDGQCSRYDAQLRSTSTTRPFRQWNLILAHLQLSEFDIVYIYGTAILTLKTFHWLCVCMDAQLYAHSETFAQCKIFSRSNTGDGSPAKIITTRNLRVRRRVPGRLL